MLSMKGTLRAVKRAPMKKPPDPNSAVICLVMELKPPGRRPLNIGTVRNRQFHGFPQASYTTLSASTFE